MQNKYITSKQLGLIVFLDIISISLWGITMIIDLVSTGSIETVEQAFTYVTNQNIFFFLNYLNAVIFTLLTTVVFIGLYLYYNPKTHSPLPLIGLVFIPIYCLMNLFAYGSQITIIPLILPYLETVEYQTSAKYLIIMLTQIYPGSPVSVINLTAYGILAIPSMIFVKEMILENMITKKIAGLFLLLNTVSCIISIFALLLLFESFAGLLSIIGGFFTLVSFIPLCIALFKEKTLESITVY